jgi:hypothetical protein
METAAVISMIDDNPDSSEPPRRSGPETDDSEPDPHPSKKRASLSQRLSELADDPSRERVSTTDLLELMPGQALAALILIFAAPNVVPAPPGLSAILGWPLIYLSWQQMMGHRPWLPPLVARQSVSRSVFARLMRRVTPGMAALERLLRPRIEVLVSPMAERLVGAICLVLAVVLLLPVPLGNMPPALAISVMMLGLLERDGLWVGIGIVLGIASFAIAVGVIYTMIRAAIFLLTRALV